MKQLILLFFFTFSFLSMAQKDQLKFNLDLTFGYLNYKYDKIENAGYGFSNMQWYDTAYSHVFNHQKYTYHGVNAVFHIGFQLPIFRNEVFSLGIWPKVGIGKIFQVSPSPGNVVDNYGWQIENDDKDIRHRSIDLQLYAYLKYNLHSTNFKNASYTLYGGYRFIRSLDNYSTPVIGLQFGQDYFSIGWYAHLTRMNYYRELSNGSIELAKSFYEFGMTTNFYLFRKKKK